MNSVLEQLLNAVGKEQVRQSEPMKNHTTFKIGGPADYFVMPKSPDELQSIIEICKDNKVKYYLLGKGSNLLVKDNGFRGVIISVSEYMKKVTVLDDGLIYAEAGATLAEIANKALENSFTGFEFASGIPGTFGGGIFMNAGAYGREIKDVFAYADILTKENERVRLEENQMKFSYRNSIIAEKGYIVLGGGIKLEKGNYDTILKEMTSMNRKRKSKQPVEKASAGSTFKRPPGAYAGKLIMECGLRGYGIGDAQVSEKHCGFVVNNGAASALQVMEVIEHIKETVFQKKLIRLEPEIRIIGD